MSLPIARENTVERGPQDGEEDGEYMDSFMFDRGLDDDDTTPDNHREADEQIVNNDPFPTEEITGVERAVDDQLAGGQVAGTHSTATDPILIGDLSDDSLPIRHPAESKPSRPSQETVGEKQTTQQRRTGQRAATGHHVSHRSVDLIRAPSEELDLDQLVTAKRTANQSSAGSKRKRENKRAALNLKLRGRETIVQRHVPFQASAGKTLPNPKVQSNKINAKGHYRERACYQCIKGIAEMKEDKEYGRGATEYLEPFSCITHASYGKKGTSCARCVGLSKLCTDFTDASADEVAAVIELASDFNTAIQQPTHLRSNAERRTIRRFIDVGTDLSRRIEAVPSKAEFKPYTVDEDGSPAKPGSASRAGQQPTGGGQVASRFDLLDLQHQVSDLHDLVEWQSKRLIDIIDLQREDSAQFYRLFDAWEASARKKPNFFAALEEAEESERFADDEDDQPPQRRRRR